MKPTPQKKTVKRIHDDELWLGDDVIIPILQDGEGKNVLEASHKREDRFAHGGPTFRIPVPARGKRIRCVVGEVWRGTIEEIVPTGRTVYRPGKREVVEIRLGNMRPVKVSGRHSYFRYRNYIVEIEEILFEGMHVATIHRNFSSEGISTDDIGLLPELIPEKHLTARKRVDWKLRRTPADKPTKKRLLAQVRQGSRSTEAG